MSRRVCSPAARSHTKTALRGKSEPRGTGAARTRAPPVWHLPPTIPPLVAAVVSRSSRRRPCANTVGLNAAHARHPSAAVCVWCLGHHAAAVVALHCAPPPPPPLRPSSTSSSPVRMRMRVLARVGEVVVASDGVASPSRGFLAIDFLMAPCRRVPWRRVFVVASLTRCDHHESDFSSSRGSLEGGASSKAPRVSDRSIDRPTTLPTAVARARRSRMAISQVHEGGAAAV